jgi:hypothetical protein
MRKRLLAVIVLVALAGCAHPPPPLTASEQAAWSDLLASYQQPGTYAVLSQKADAVAAVGDKIVPYIESSLGRSGSESQTRGDYWLIVVLARIGTPRAVQALGKVLRHEYRGAVGRDRLLAAQAVVWLGAIQALPDLQAAVTDHNKRLAAWDSQSGLAPSLREEYASEAKQLAVYLQTLQGGQGKQDTRYFPVSSTSAPSGFQTSGSPAVGASPVANPGTVSGPGVPAPGPRPGVHADTGRK